MQRIGLFVGTKIGDRERCDERPMAEPDQRISNEGACQPVSCPDAFAAGHPSSPAPQAINLSEYSGLPLI
jgi:hypothetical protein